MKPALLLVDLQNDYLDRGPLVPDGEGVLKACASLLEGFRSAGAPVVHVQTLIHADGENRMPHWKRDGYWACVEGTPGAAAPDRLEPASGEPVIGKTFYSGFSVPELDSCLRATGARTLVVAGLYLHACVSATVLDAYQRGYSVLVGADAVASRSSEQLDVARDFLSGRAAMFRPVAEIVATLDSAGESA